MPKILFCVNNHHTKDTPTIDGDDGNYHSYFENSFGEQWLFTYNRKEDMVYIQGGDVGWALFGLQHIRSYILGPEEKLWLDACLQAIKAGRFEDYIKPHPSNLYERRRRMLRERRNNVNKSEGPDTEDK